MKSQDNKNISELIEAVVKLEDASEAQKFLRDLMTDKELIEFGKRWKVARMLSEGVTYVEIEKSTGMSSTTIARIHKWVKEGEGGYNLMIKKK